MLDVKHVAVSLLLVVVMINHGCSGKKDAPAEKKENEKPVVALVMKSLANEFFKTMEEGAVAHQKAHADQYELICNGIKNELDVSKQIEIVDGMIAKGVDALVIAPADSKALIGICKRALDNGVVVVNIDNKFDAETLRREEVVIPFVGPDNRKGAKMAADHLAAQLRKGDKVAILEGKPGAFNGLQRRLGFEDAIKEAGLALCTSQSANWEMQPAYAIADQIYTKYGDELKAVLCANDTMALGASRALQGKGVKIIGFDNISAVQTLIRRGGIVCTVDQHGDRIAVYGIKYALEIIESGAAPENRETPVDLITRETLSKSS